MPSFEEMFSASEGHPVSYRNALLYSFDMYELTTGGKLRFVLESTNSEWRQGVCFWADGALEVNNEKFKSGLTLWEDTVPAEVDITYLGKEGKVYLKNVWDCGSGTMESWHNGAAMIIEVLEVGRRYRCNDGNPDEDFDDIIFAIQQKG